MEIPHRGGYRMKIILIITMVFISGCAEYRTLIGSYGAESADAALESSEWGVCKAATAGALERRYSLYSDTSGPKATAWRGLCYGGE